jgi:hypothetical protein
LRIFRQGWVKIASGIALGANALDVTTSLIPYTIDVAVEIPPRSTVEWTIQLLLSAVGLTWLFRSSPALLRAVRELPVPRPALIVCGLFLLIEVGHIALRYERFPFSPVAMYSDGQIKTPELWDQRGFLIQHADGTRFFSFQREGDPLFASYFEDLDYKGSAALRMYRTEPRVHRIVAKAVMAKGLPPPVSVLYTYRTSDGAIVAVRPEPPRRAP